MRARRASAEPWPLRVVGTGPAQGVAEALVRRLRLDGRVAFRPCIAERAALADECPSAACVVMPGRYETFAPRDLAGLLGAVERPRAPPRDVFAAARMVARHAWDRAIEAELRDLARLCA